MPHTQRRDGRLASGRAPSIPARVWWTRGRVLAALQRLHRETGRAPLSSRAWQRLTRGGPSPAARRRFPSCHTVLRHFASFRQAWRAAGVEVERSGEAWTALEDWYLAQALGLLPRKEIAGDLGRSDAAVKKRQGRLALCAAEARGWPLQRVEQATQVPAHVFRAAMERGELAAYKGSKYLYLDPGDLPLVAKIDWTRVSPDLEAATLRSLRQRLVQILAGHDWRVGRPHQARRRRQTGARRAPRGAPPGPRPAGTATLSVGDQVRAARPVHGRSASALEVGTVVLIYWSRNHWARNPARPDPAPQWMARVRFSHPTRTYTLPLATLVSTSEAPAGSEPHVPSAQAAST